MLVVSVVRFSFHAVAALLIVAGMLVAGAAGAGELPELAAQTSPSVVHLSVFDGSEREVSTGTGFFVGGNRIATNQHVIAGAASMVAKLADGRVLEVAGLLASDEDRDVAIIMVTGDDLPPPLRLGKSAGLRQGDEVVVIGSPHGLAGTLSMGLVSALRGEGVADDAGDRHHWAIQVTAAISPGSSGSPIMTRDGDVVAVAVGIMRGGANIGFGVPVEVLVDMLATIPPDAKPAAFEGASSVTRNLLISALFFGAIALAFVIPSLVKRLRSKRAA